MGVKQTKVNFVYGVGDNLIILPPQPIIAKRNPTTSDFAQLGTVWVNEVSGSIWGLASISANSADWVTSPASGVGSFTDLTVTTGNAEISLGNLTLPAGDITLTSGDVTVGGDLTVAGTLSFTGDLDLSSAALIDLTSTLDAAPSIYLRANGGTSEQIRIHADQSTLTNAIELDADAGGITLVSGMASADAFNLVGTAGGLDVDMALGINIATSQDANNALSLISSAGGMSLAATGEAGQDIDITNTGGSLNLTATENAADAVVITSDGGTTSGLQLVNATGTAADSVDISSTAGGLTFTSNLATDDGINFVAVGGGIDLDAGLQISITSTENAADAINIAATSGGIDVTATGGAGEDLDLACTNGSVNVTSGEAVADAIVIHATDAAGGVQIRAGTGAIQIGTDADTTPIQIGDIAPTASRTTTVGGGTVVTASVTDLVDIAPDGATTNADSVKQVDIATGAVTTGQNIVNIATGTAASGTHTVNVSTNTGGGTKTVNIGNADGNTTTNIDGVLLVNDSVNSNASINTGTSTGTVSIGNSAAGAITVDTAAGISLDGATASNFTVTGSGEDLTLSSAGGSVAISSTEDVASAISLVANGGTSETIAITASQGTGADSVDVTSTAGGITCTTAALAATTGLHVTQGAATAAIQVGSGAPSHSAPQGSLYLRTDGSSTSTRLYVNTNGTTGWTNMVSAT